MLGQIRDLEFQKGVFLKLFRIFRKKGSSLKNDQNNSTDNLYISVLIERNIQSECQQ